MGIFFFQDSQEAVSLHFFKQEQDASFLQAWKSWLLLLFTLLSSCWKSSKKSPGAILLLELWCESGRVQRAFRPLVLTECNKECLDKELGFRSKAKQGIEVVS